MSDVVPSTEKLIRDALPDACRAAMREEELLFKLATLERDVEPRDGDDEVLE